MNPRDVKTAEDAKKLIRSRGLKHVKVGLFDLDGVMRGKYMASDKFIGALDKGFGFCDVVLGWDSNDQLYNNQALSNQGVRYTGWHTGYPDAPVRIIPESCREVMDEPGMLLFLAEFDDKASDLCPRNLLKRVLDRLAENDLSAKAAFEYEFFLFEETPHSIREKNYRDLKPFTPGFFGYSMLRNSVHSELYQELLQLSEDMDFPIESLHTETGPGVLEAAITVDDALQAADKAALFKTYVKAWAQRKGLMATFMAKWSNDYPGQSGHIHTSLFDEDGHNLFFDPSRSCNISVVAEQFIAGQQALVPEWLCLFAQTVNAYSRLVPGFWAPTDATWGIENRTTALRVIPGSEKSQRVEFRLGSADANPYLALAGALAAGYYGMEHGIAPHTVVTGNAYDQQHPEELALAGSLHEAAQRFRDSDIARDYFGEDFVEHYAATREWEEREFRRHVSDWELARYFEII